MPVWGTYLILCIICAILARGTFIRFWGGLFLSMLLTPVVGLVAVFFLRWMKARRDRNRLLKDPALFEAMRNYHGRRQARARARAQAES